MFIHLTALTKSLKFKLEDFLFDLSTLISTPFKITTKDKGTVNQRHNRKRIK